MFGGHDVRRKRCMRLQISVLCTAVGHTTLVTYVSLFMFWCSWCEKKKRYASADRCIVHSFRSQALVYVPLFMFGGHNVRRKRCVRLQISALCTALGHMALVYIPLFMFGGHNVRRKRCVHLQISVLCTAVGHTTLVYVPCSCFGAHDMRRKRCMRLQIGALCTAVGHTTLVTYVPLFMFWCSWCEKEKMHASADRCIVHSCRSQGTCYLHSPVHALVVMMWEEKGACVCRLVRCAWR